MHVLEFRAPAAQSRHDVTLRIGVGVDRDLLVRFVRSAVDLFDDHARSGNRHFIAFAAHVLQQYAEMQFAAAEHDELVGIRGRFHS